MHALTNNTRKAAILIRSLDTQTAGVLLAQLSAEEADAVRTAIKALGPVDPDEEADVVAEFRRVGPLATQPADQGVELTLSTSANSQKVERSSKQADLQTSKPFRFLETAALESLVPCLAREHAQTIAVVLSYLEPVRAAELLAALPPRVQAESLERLTALGESDPGSLQVLERELAAWVERQQSFQSCRGKNRNLAAAILAASNGNQREQILANLKLRNQRLADDLSPDAPPTSWRSGTGRTAREEADARRDRAAQGSDLHKPEKRKSDRRVPPSPPRESPAPAAELTTGRAVLRTRSTVSPVAFDFHEIQRLNAATLRGVMTDVDADVLVLALAGANDELVERITSQMPRRVAKLFRRRLRRLGPTRLRDVEQAQQAVAAVAARIAAPREARLDLVTT